MTTPDPALDATLDRYEAAMEAEMDGRLECLNVDISEADYDALKAELTAARAAVVACAAPARERVENLEALLKQAQFACRHWPEIPPPLHGIKSALCVFAQDGEPEDAGAGTEG